MKTIGIIGLIKKPISSPKRFVDLFLVLLFFDFDTCGYNIQLETFNTSSDFRMCIVGQFSFNLKGKAPCTNTQKLSFVKSTKINLEISGVELARLHVTVDSMLH